MREIVATSMVTLILVSALMARVGSAYTPENNLIFYTQAVPYVNPHYFKTSDNAQFVAVADQSPAGGSYVYTKIYGFAGIQLVLGASPVIDRSIENRAQKR